MAAITALWGDSRNVDKINQMAADRFKRMFDIALALPGLIVALPILAITAVIVRVKLGSPILFVQPRSGIHGRSFRLYKFRSMKPEIDAAGNRISEAARIPPFGHFIRASSLDELPSLINVLKGDLSLVGPRPLLSEYDALYSPFQKRRLEVRPGITGWAQINGRNAITWDKKFELDVWYVDHRSFALDLRILLATAGKVFARDGINSGSEVTMERFTGSGT